MSKRFVKVSTGIPIKVHIIFRIDLDMMRQLYLESASLTSVVRLISQQLPITRSSSHETDP